MSLCLVYIRIYIYARHLLLLRSLLHPPVPVVSRRKVGKVQHAEFVFVSRILERGAIVLTAKWRILSNTTPRGVMRIVRETTRPTGILFRDG